LISCGPLVALSPVAGGGWFPYSGREQFLGEFVNLSEPQAETTLARANVVQVSGLSSTILTPHRKALKA